MTATRGARPVPSLPRSRRISTNRCVPRFREGGPRDVAQSPPDAIPSGAVRACAGAVGGMARAMGERGSPPGRIILSGGAAAEIAAALPIPPTHRENLVLEGLVLIARNS